MLLDISALRSPKQLATVESGVPFLVWLVVFLSTGLVLDFL